MVFEDATIEKCFIINADSLSIFIVLFKWLFLKALKYQTGSKLIFQIKLCIFKSAL